MVSPARRRRPAGPATALAAALDRAGDRWLLLVVDALVDGPQRYGELAERVVRFTYDLTADGRALADALVPLAAWGAAAEGRAPARFHQPCGTGIELRAWCPTCDRSAIDEATSAYDL